MSNTKVLFISPNPAGMSLVPPTVGLFYSIFTANDIEMKYFDTTPYDTSNKYSDPVKFLERNLIVKKNDDKLKAKKVIKTKLYSEMLPDLKGVVNDLKPDVIMASATESTFLFTVDLLKSVREYKIPHVLGGVFATFAPNVALSYDEIDMVCIGEGEKVIVPLSKSISSDKDLSSIPNIWIKQKDGAIRKNQLSPPVDINENPPIDVSIFDDYRFYRTMGGNMYRLFPVETHRGCVHRCNFCNSPLQKDFYQEETGVAFFRKKAIKNVMVDIRNFIENYDAEYLHFWADDFFSYTNKEIDQFCEEYKDIKLPFYAQSYPTDINEDKLKKLVDVGLERIGIGIEHGNEEFRATVINRKYKNSNAINGIKLLKSYDIIVACNNILGFPDETPELHMDTVELNHIMQPHGASASIFTPFYGTPLRELALKKGYLKDPNVIAPTNSEESILEMPQFTKEQISGKSRTFNLYIKFPKTRWSEIQKAEALTPEGDRIWSDLKEEYASL